MLKYIEGTPSDLMFGPFKANRCYFIDCLDGMAQIPGKPFGLTITDPPYNRDLGKWEDDYERFSKVKNFMKGGHFKKDNINYNDDMPKEEYEQFSRRWFEMAIRLSEVLVFTPGNQNSDMWSDIAKPKEKMIHYKPNCVSFTHGVRFNKYDDILVYGNVRRFHFRTNVYEIPIDSSFISKYDIKHICPKEVKLWRVLISRAIQRVDTKVIFDPMVGSGTTIQIAEELRLPWLAFEINTEYEGDIRTRIKLGRKPKTNLDDLK